MITRTEQDAYGEMAAACKVVVDRIREYPDLFNQLIEEVELALITIAMKRSNDNCAQAAELLGINRTTLVEKRRRFGMLKARSG